MDGLIMFEGRLGLAAKKQTQGSFVDASLGCKHFIVHVLAIHYLLDSILQILVFHVTSIFEGIEASSIYICKVKSIFREKQQTKNKFYFLKFKFIYRLRLNLDLLPKFTPFVFRILNTTVLYAINLLKHRNLVIC